MFARREYQLFRKSSSFIRSFTLTNKNNISLFNRATRFFSTFEETEGDIKDWADAFPIMNLIPEELLRDLTEKKRMKKLEIEQPKKEISLNGIFPEVIIDSEFGGEVLN